MNKKTFYTNEGRRLEASIHDILEPYVDKIITDDNKIKKYFASGAVVGIDHYIEIGNYIITIQDKWEEKSPSIRDINHFTQATKVVEKYMKKNDKKLLFLLFVSKKSITKNGIDIINECNNVLSSDIYFTIDDNSSIENLTLKVKNFVLDKLDFHGIKIKKKNTEVYTLRPYQEDSVKSFSGMIDRDINSGIVNYPTGTGKTIIALAMVGEFMRKSGGLSIMWITRRIDIMNSQFGNNKEKLDICIKSGFLPDYDKYNLLLWYNNRNDIELLNEKLSYDKPVFLITNIDSIMYKEKYKNIVNNKFGMIILDECHSSGAEHTFSMLSYFIENWLNFKFLAGFSATPIRQESRKIKRTKELFGDGNYIRFISRMSAEDAIDKEIIVPPEFFWVETLIDKDITFSSFIKNISSEEYNILIHHIDDILGKSVTKKAIFWAKDTNNANEWLKILKSCKNEVSKYTNLKDFELMISHSKVSNNDLELFTYRKKPTVIICVGRCIEGFDVPQVDTVVNLDPVKKRGLIVFLQKLGRAQRRYNGKTRCQVMDTFTLSNHEDKKKQIAELILGYTLFLGDVDAENIDDKTKSEQYEKIKKIVNPKPGGLKITTKGGKTININIEMTTLRNFKWSDVDEELKIQIRNNFYRNGIGYETVRSIIRNYNPKPITKSDYYELVKKDNRLPEEPELVFKGQFTNWIDYLSIERKYYDIDICKEKCSYYLKNGNIEIKNQFDYAYVCEQLCKIDEMFPPNEMWIDYYNMDIENIIKIPIFIEKNIEEILELFSY